MDTALIEAEMAGTRGEVPVGAVIVHDNKIIAKAGNETRGSFDATAHAEILVIRKACKIFGQEKLFGFDIYVTLEPCAMCAGAISNARISRVYYGASDPKSGGLEQGARVFNQSQCHHKPDVYDGINAQRSQKLLSDFFAKLRK